MLRWLFPASRIISRTAPLVQNVLRVTAATTPASTRGFSCVLPKPVGTSSVGLLANPQLIQISNNITKRNLTKFSTTTGKRKSVKAVPRRFYRLAWGIWIRTKCGRHKKIWKKRAARRRRLRQHVFCNATQSTLLDKMAGPFWTRRRYYVDDPYEPYHNREEFLLTYTKPKPFIPPTGTVPNC